MRRFMRNSDDYAGKVRSSKSEKAMVAVVKIDYEKSFHEVRAL